MNKLNLVVLFCLLGAASAGAGEAKEDLKVLSVADVGSLAGQAITAVKTCEGISAIKKIESIEVKNSTDESLDKTIIIDALTRELSKKMKIKVKAADEKETKYVLKAQLAARKTESESSYKGEYQLKLEFMTSSGDVTCWSNASLTKHN